MGQNNFNKELEKTKAIRLGTPVTSCGLTFYPILMADYDLFKICSSAWCFRLATLPAKYARENFLTALFTYDLDLVKDGQNATGLFVRVIQLFFMSLKIQYDLNKMNDFIKFKVDDKGRTKIDKLIINQNGSEVEITSSSFTSKIRPLIAEMNGLTLPNERDNLDLVRDAELKRQFNARQNGSDKLNYSTDDLIASVAYLSHVRERDILDWTIREFEGRVKAIDRDKNFMLYSQAQLGGMVTFKNGNPYKSWCFDEIDESLGTQSLDSTTIDGVKIK